MAVVAPEFGPPSSLWTHVKDILTNSSRTLCLIVKPTCISDTQWFEEQISKAGLAYHIHDFPLLGHGASEPETYLVVHKNESAQHNFDASVGRGWCNSISSIIRMNGPTWLEWGCDMNPIETAIWREETVKEQGGRWFVPAQRRLAGPGVIGVELYWYSEVLAA